MSRGAIYVGTSGYSYLHWREVFYPRGLPQARWLEHYAGHFDTVELNVTFYRLPPENTFEGWRNRTPRGFRFAVKGWRMVTHRKYLKDCGDQVKRVFESAAALGGKLAVVLWQLPPRLELDLVRLRDFLDLARGMSRIRQAVEFRHPSWYKQEVYDCLAKRRFALCLADMPRARIDDVTTADFVYVRRHGPQGTYRRPYTKRAMAALARKASRWAEEGKDVFIYFNNDYAGHAVMNAEQVLDTLRQQA